jgi:hypothetical protein
MNLQEAVNRACQESSLVDALTWIATWDSSRAIEQAVEFGRTGIRTGAGDAAWDTCFRVCFTAVMEAWPKRSPIMTNADIPDLSLRDHFAVEALKVFLKTEPITHSMEKISEKAYSMADAMMVARNGKVAP